MGYFYHFLKYLISEQKLINLLRNYNTPQKLSPKPPRLSLCSVYKRKRWRTHRKLRASSGFPSLSIVSPLIPLSSRALLFRPFLFSITGKPLNSTLKIASASPAIASQLPSYSYSCSLLGFGNWQSPAAACGPLSVLQSRASDSTCKIYF